MYNFHLRIFGVTAALLLSACGTTSNLDWDLRNNAGSTHDAAAQVTGDRPAPDPNGVISYPGYQVIVARRGDTVDSLATRVGLTGDALGKFNALKATDTLRGGEVLALPVRVASPRVSAWRDSGLLQGQTLTRTRAQPTPGISRTRQ